MYIYIYIVTYVRINNPHVPFGFCRHRDLHDSSLQNDAGMWESGFALKCLLLVLEDESKQSMNVGLLQYALLTNVAPMLILYHFVAFYSVPAFCWWLNDNPTWPYPFSLFPVAGGFLCSDQFA